ncbi:hypothetical protein PVL29_011707 [Vitis rotundifolia]|uniref:DUF7795 domain-containing protein n=1 Tax=Vitis rotundifolia TaxID=103349 RepID=A0AA38ZP95_VITRO|nr:hypothetical protein PVL29_011707 [Vitis rotundifolia]
MGKNPRLHRGPSFPSARANKQVPSTDSVYFDFRYVPINLRLQLTGSGASIWLRMEDEECNLLIEPRQRIVQKFSDFMTRVAEFEELAAVGSRLLIGFQQGLEFLRRPPINKTSELVEKIIKSNETKRVKSYVEAGCIDSHDGTQNISKLHTCQLGLQDHLSKAKCILSEIESLIDDVVGGMQTTNENLSDLQDRYFDKWDQQEPAYDKEEITSTHASHLQKHEAIDYAAMMGIIFSMVKQDYVMQERIVSSLNLKSLAGELESYCLMWSLRPFINDEIMHQAWKLLP